MMMIGCDAILSDGSAINKIGSGMFAEIAHIHGIPVYVVADSWKFSSRAVKIEQRNFKEIWRNAPKRVRVKNPAFEIVEAKYIKAIVSELGILKPEKFVRKVKRAKELR
jgi:translation initiation factor 2B subunit (eIF-2B alpha/beta/delta family)